MGSDFLRNMAPAPTRHENVKLL